MPIIAKSRTVRRAWPLALLALLIGGSVAIAQSSPPHSSPPSSNRYVALVLGLGGYVDALKVPDAVENAHAVAQRLENRGFDLIGASSSGTCNEIAPIIDGDRAQLLAALKCFKDASRGAQQAVLYISGQTFAVQDKNFLLPVGSAADKVDELVDLSVHLTEMEAAAPGAFIVIIDGARRSVRSVNRSARGSVRPPSTRNARIVASAASSGRWFEAGDAQGGGRAEPSKTGLSPFTRRLVEALDEEFDLRFWKRPGQGIDTILMRASAGETDGTSGEVLIDNMAGAEMLGRLPAIGSGLCDALKWRSDKLGRCIEMAATYEHCGKSPEMQRRLKAQCLPEWHGLVREGLRGTMVSAMREKTCTSLRKLVGVIRAEPTASDLPERKEIEALEQYTCAIETREKVRAEAPAVLAGRDCRAVQTMLVEHGPLLEADLTNRLKAHARTVCCPDYGTQKECLTRSTFLSRMVAKLEERGCQLGTNRDAKNTRALQIMERLNQRKRMVADVNGNGSLVDPMIEAVGAIDRADCAAASVQSPTK